jgi:hypothetical protein
MRSRKTLLDGIARIEGRPAPMIADEPATANEWSEHLRRVEKQAAVILLNPPFAYAVRWRAGGARTKPAVRLSAILSLSVGPPLPQRLTFTVSRGTTRVRASAGERLARRRGEESSFVTVMPPWVAETLKPLAEAVAQACAEYQMRPDVQKALTAIWEQRRLDLSQVEVLYGSRDRGDRLLGLSPEGTDGSAALEAELARLLAIVRDRYRVRVWVRMLSLGILGG